MASLLPVQIKDHWFAIDASAVREILGPRPWAVIPGASSEIPGVLGWKGRAIVVVDLGAMAARPAPLVEGEVRARTLVVEAGACFVAIPVDAAREAKSVSPERIHAPQLALEKFASAETELDGIPIAVVDVAALIETLKGAQKG